MLFKRDISYTNICGYLGVTSIYKTLYLLNDTQLTITKSMYLLHIVHDLDYHEKILLKDRSNIESNTAGITV